MSGSVHCRISSKDLNSETVEVNVKEEMTSSKADLLEEFIPNNHPSQTTSFDDDIEIKHEEVDYHDHDNASSSDAEDDSRLKTLSGILHVDCSFVKATEKDLHAFYLDQLQCEEDCDTCQKYLRILSELSEHVRSAHGPSEPIQDPLLIDPLNIDRDTPHAEHSSPIQFKCEVDENIDKMECSKEDLMLNSEANPEFEAKSVSECDPDYTPSPHLNRNGRGSVKRNARSNFRSSKSEKGTKASQQHKRFRCNVCDKSFSSTGNLNEHKKIHTGERPYNCDVCEKSFSQKTNLTIHKRTHTGEKPYKCDMCNNSWTSGSALSVHKRTHTGEKPYMCEVCKRSFARSGDLTSHKRIHTGERPYKCVVCEKCFARSCDLSGHMRSHTAERPFKC